MPPNRTWTNESLERAVKDSTHYREVLRILGLSNGASNFRRIKQAIADNGLDTAHFLHRRPGRRPKLPPETVLVKDSKATILTIRKYARDVLEYQCSICGNDGQHNGKELTLQLDHINGDSHDSRIENLRWLCPNCHSQTETFCGRNVRK